MTASVDMASVQESSVESEPLDDFEPSGDVKKMYPYFWSWPEYKPPSKSIVWESSDDAEQDDKVDPSDGACTASAWVPAGFRLVDTDRTGNCCPASLEYLLNVESLRKSLAVWRKSRLHDPDFAESVRRVILVDFHEGDVPSYIEHMSNACTWWGELELSNVAEMLEVNIIVHQEGLPNLVYGPSSSDTIVDLWYDGRKHYQALQPVKASAPHRDTRWTHSEFYPYAHFGTEVCHPDDPKVAEVIASVQFGATVCPEIVCERLDRTVKSPLCYTTVDFTFTRSRVYAKQVHRQACVRWYDKVGVAIGTKAETGKAENGPKVCARCKNRFKIWNWDTNAHDICSCWYRTRWDVFRLESTSQQDTENDLAFAEYNSIRSLFKRANIS